MGRASLRAVGMDPTSSPSASAAHQEAVARQVLEDIALNGTPPDRPLDDYIRILAEYRTTCERRGQYKEAQLVQRVLTQLREEEEARCLMALMARQETERQGLEQAHVLEFQTFHRLWNDKIDAFERQHLDAEAAMLERHSTELAGFHAEAADQPQRRPKFSKDLLNLRRVEATLAKGKHYAEAHRVKVTADDVEAREWGRINQERAERFSRREAQLLARHRMELTAMRTRMERARQELERTRLRELQLLLRRYGNVKRGITGQQNVLTAKTGTLLSKHAANRNADTPASWALSASTSGGAFGAPGRRRPTPEAAPSASPRTVSLPPITH